MLQEIQQALRRKGYRVHNRPHELNIVGVRSASNVPNAFDDILFVFFMEGSQWRCQHFQITTDPGLPFLQRPINKSGTAILKPSQYVDAYGIGLHRGLYQALVQTRPVTVIRDFDRDNRLDFTNAKQETGMFGINIHRAEQNGAAKIVASYSAGCQVFANAGDFNIFMDLCLTHRKHYGNRFTYTLLEEPELPAGVISQVRDGWTGGPFVQSQQSSLLAA